MCGAEEQNKKKFYNAHWSVLWKRNDNTPPICRECLEDLIVKYTQRYGSERIAVKIICHYLDAPFEDSIYDSVINNNTSFNLGIYLRSLNTQARGKSFLNSILDGSLNKDEKELQEEREVKWSRSDKQNKVFVINTVGYDPFDSPTLNDEDRRDLFNALAGYCNDSSVTTDNHKLQSVIHLVHTQLQCKKIDDYIYAELMMKEPDDAKINKLGATKKSLSDLISTISKDNNIASNYNASSKQGTGTASHKMKEIERNDFELIRVNLFDIETAEAMKQTMDLSNQSIMEQIQLDETDYTEMLKDQREIIQGQKTRLDSVEEENRLLKSKLQEYKLSQKKKKGKNIVIDEDGDD